MTKMLALGLMMAVVVGLGPSAREARAQTKDTVDTAVAAGSFTTLAKALDAAGLVETLKGPGPFTVFAPTDEAFARLPAGTLDMLLEPANRAKLQRILTYHVVAGRLTASDVGKMHTAKAVSGDMLSMATSNGGVTVDDAHVVTADIMASNGIIHVIDAVILPEDD
jgi:uncharacterized surface protein with fasciclin (FAS1) repeats